MRRLRRILAIWILGGCASPPVVDIHEDPSPPTESPLVEKPPTTPSPSVKPPLPWALAFNLPTDLDRYPAARLGKATDLHELDTSLVYRRSGQLWKASFPPASLRALSTGPGAKAYPTWDPAGAKLTYLTMRDGVRRIEITDADAQRVLFRGRNLVGEGICGVAPAFSPDGRTLVYGACTAKNGRGVDLRAAAVNRPGAPDESILTDPRIEGASFSPEGSRLAVLMREETEASVQILDIATHRSLGVVARAREIGAVPIWLSSQELLVPMRESADEDCPVQLWRIGIPSHSSHAFAEGLTLPPGQGRLILSPDRQRIAVSWSDARGPAWNAEVILVDMDGRRLIHLGQPFPKPYYALSAPTFACDSKHLALTLTVCTSASCDPAIRAVVLARSDDAERLWFVDYGSAATFRGLTCTPGQPLPVPRDPGAIRTPL